MPWRIVTARNQGKKIKEKGGKVFLADEGKKFKT